VDILKVKFKGRAVKENSYMELECDTIKDNYSVSQRDISVVVHVNGNYMFSLKEYFEVEVLD
jgi:hypothetical protein